MAACFSFGSFGDIITLCQLAKAGVDALDDSRGSAASYQSLRSALSNLTYVLFKVKALTETGKIIDLEILKHTLEDCFSCLKDFSDKIEKYGNSLGAKNGSGNWIKDSYRKVKWTGMKEDTAVFHDNVAMYMAMLQLLLQSAGFDVQAQDKKQLYKRLEEADSREHSRFQDTNQRLQTGFSTQRVLLGQIIERVEALGITGISNEQRKVADDIRSLERRATSSVFIAASSANVQESYEAAIASSRQEVSSLIRLHRRSNSRFVDPNFDLGKLYGAGARPCIENLAGDGPNLSPESYMMLEDICHNPQFRVNGFDYTNVDSPISDMEWLSPALAVLSSIPGLLENICHTRDEQLGIYGFAFYRDGECAGHVVDATLYLEKPLWSPSLVDQFTLKLVRRGIQREPDIAYREAYLTGTQALYFSASYDTNETWPSLMEKAYAKAHGDYGSLCGKSIADVLEDFTGGVTLEMRISEILNYQRLWVELSTTQSDVFIGVLPRDEQAYVPGGANESTKPLSQNLAASILKAREIKDHKLLLVKDPGWLRWDGAWSDGSSEWTAEWLQLLDHRFGHDDSTWMSYRDFLSKFSFILAHQIFDSDWTVSQQWYTFEVPLAMSRTEEYFKVTVQPQVQEDNSHSNDERDQNNDQIDLTIVLSQLDTAYFRGLEGRYQFDIRLEVEDEHGELIARTRQRILSKRSAAVKLHTTSSLGRQSYYVRPNVVATKMPESHSIDKTIARSIDQKREKLLQAALSYDVAHAKVPGWGEKCDKVRQRQQGRRRWEPSSSVHASSGAVDASLPYSIRDNTTLIDEPWDALCCMGLRVYAKGAETTIEIRKGSVGGEHEDIESENETVQGEAAPVGPSDGSKPNEEYAASTQISSSV